MLHNTFFQCIRFSSFLYKGESRVNPIWLTVINPWTEFDWAWNHRAAVQTWFVFCLVAFQLIKSNTWKVKAKNDWEKGVICVEVEFFSFALDVYTQNPWTRLLLYRPLQNSENCRIWKCDEILFMSMDAWTLKKFKDNSDAEKQRRTLVQKSQFYF